MQHSRSKQVMKESSNFTAYIINLLWQDSDDKVEQAFQIKLTSITLFWYEFRKHELVALVACCHYYHRFEENAQEKGSIVVNQTTDTTFSFRMSSNNDSKSSKVIMYTIKSINRTAAKNRKYLS
jgi:hypothetical protein